MDFDPAPIPASQRNLALKALNLSIYYLGLDEDPPGIRFFRPTGGEHEEVTETRFRRDPMQGPARLKGVCLEFDNDVWVRNDLSDRELVLTIAHELYHRKEFIIGRESSEVSAENFGKMILYKLQHPMQSTI